VRKYILAAPPGTLSQRIYRQYWRATFLTRRVVRFKDVLDDKGKLDGVLVFPTRLPIKPCVQHMMFKKGFKVKDKRCKDDLCRICRPENYPSQKVTSW